MTTARAIDSVVRVQPPVRPADGSARSSGGADQSSSPNTRRIATAASTASHSQQNRIGTR